MRLNLCAITGIFTVLASGCATPPTADPSTVDATCAQQCSGNLATCSSGFKLFPIVQQKQCNDTYDVCIKGCPPRTSGTTTSPAKQTQVIRIWVKLRPASKNGLPTWVRRSPPLHPACQSRAQPCSWVPDCSLSHAKRAPRAEQGNAYHASRRSRWHC